MSFLPNHFVDVKRRPFFRRLINSYICWRAFGYGRRASLKAAWAISRWRGLDTRPGRLHIAWWVRPALAIAFLCGVICPARVDRWIDFIVDHGIKFGVDMKLQQLRTNLPAAASRVTMLPNQRPDTVERKRGSAGVRDREYIRARDCGICQECRRKGVTTIGGPVDHIVPLWKGGSDDKTNKEVLCVPCHDAKTAREAVERARGV